MKILMCRPSFFGIEYEINPWMDKNRKVDQKKAETQWESLQKTILDCGANVQLVQPEPGWPDMVFTANAGLFYQNKIILPRFKFKERQGELPFFQNWFTDSGYQTINQENEQENYFEGAGDALFAGDQLFVGYGFRSDRDFYETANYLDHKKLIYCELADPYFYHLDTCFCPLNDELAMWYPNAFSSESQKRMSESIKLLPVIESEARRFACNAVVLGKHVILPSGCPNISDLLTQHDFIVHSCVVDEFLKAGGACKCLTLRID